MFRLIYIISTWMVALPFIYFTDVCLALLLGRLPDSCNMQRFQFVSAVYFCNLCENQIGYMRNWGVHCT